MKNIKHQNKIFFSFGFLLRKGIAELKFLKFLSFLKIIYEDTIKIEEIKNTKGDNKTSFKLRPLSKTA